MASNEIQTAPEKLTVAQPAKKFRALMELKFHCCFHKITPAALPTAW
jgi:hypothetical protein